MKRQTFVMYRKTVMCLLIVSFTLSLVSVYRSVFDVPVYTLNEMDSKVQQKFTVVVDAGHGGEDGGAVGISGAVEKNINLSIALELEKLLKFSGIDCIMTRRNDILLYNPGQESRKKYYDVRNRVDIANTVENPIFVSIHQNKFPVEKYKGLQVYFSKNNSMSQILAENIQENAKSHLLKDNNRKIKEAGRNIYLLNNLYCPSVLVECGFLSNSQEEKMLTDEKYQKKIAFILFKSISELIYENYSVSERKV